MSDLPNTHRMPLQICPRCGFTLNRSTGVGHGDAPQVGDYTICVACTSVLQFADGLFLVPARGEFPEEVIRARQWLIESKKEAGE